MSLFKKFKSPIAFIVTLVLLLSLAMPSTSFASSVGFLTKPQYTGEKSNGSGEVAPRGFSVATDKGEYWLNSQYNNDFRCAVYTGTYTGTAIIPSYKADGSDYTFYAYIDKNPGLYKDYIVLYKDGIKVPNFSNYIGTAFRDETYQFLDPSGQSHVWYVPITIPRSSNILEPGHHYEFAFLRGIRANNGVTCVTNSGNTGYLSGTLTSDEQIQYDTHKNDEYYYRQYAQIYDLTSPTTSPSYVSTNDEGTFYPMRYSFDTGSDSASVAIAGSSTVNAGTAAVTAAYTGIINDGIFTSSALTWSLDKSYPGISINRSTGVLTVLPYITTDTAIKVQAASDSIFTDKAITVKAYVPTAPSAPSFTPGQVDTNTTAATIQLPQVSEQTVLDSSLLSAIPILKPIVATNTDNISIGLKLNDLLASGLSSNDIASLSALEISGTKITSDSALQNATVSGITAGTTCTLASNPVSLKVDAFLDNGNYVKVDQFTSPVSVSIPVTDSAALSGKTLYAARFENGQWVKKDVATLNGNIATFTTNQFSIWTIVAEASTYSDSEGYNADGEDDTGTGSGTGTGTGDNPLSFLGIFLATLSGGNPAKDCELGDEITGGTKVPLDATIAINIDKNIVCNEVWKDNSKKIKLVDEDGNNVPITVNRVVDSTGDVQGTSEWKRYIFITPKSDLLPGTEYKIIIDQTLTAKNGNTIGENNDNEDLTISFTTVGTAEEVGGTTSSTTVTPVTDANGNAKVTMTDTQISEMLKNITDKAPIMEIKLAATTGITLANIEFTKNSMNQIANNKVEELKINTPFGQITFGKAAINSINGQSTGNISVSVAKVDSSTLSSDAKAIVGDRPVLDLKVVSNNQAISTFGGGTVSVTVPYTLKEGENSDNIIIYYINEQGKPEIIKESCYNEDTEVITFTTTHFSKYAVGYNNSVLTDTVNHWAKDSIDYLVARGIINGVGNNKFEPNSNITRAQFVKILAGSLDGIDVSKVTPATFNDVQSEKWYSGSINWAVEKGIAKGYSNGKFGLNDSITREQMAVMIYNFAKTAGYELPQTNTQTVFSDQAQISPWAKDAVGVMQKAGIINGKQGNLFDPQGKATRAEAAKMISILLKGMLN